MNFFSRLSWCLVLLGLALFLQPTAAQSGLPGIPFQMQARDRFNQPVKQQSIHLRAEIYISRDSQQVYIEEQVVQTDELGIFQFSLGKGNFIGGTYSSLYKIPWEKLDYRIRFLIAIPPQPFIPAWDYQQNWVDLGSSPVGIVPFALYAVQTAGYTSVKSKGRSLFLSATDSLSIQLEAPLELDDGIAVTLEADRVPLSSPSYFVHRDILRNQLIVFFTAPFTGYITWLIID